MLDLLFLAPITGLAPQFQTPAPGTQNCPDGSVVAATAACPVALPNHRYLLSHEPRRREVVEQWWCGRSEKPNRASIAVELKQPDASSKEPYYVSRLVALSVDGEKPSARLLQEVRSKVDGVSQVLRISTRCQDTPLQGVIGVLNVAYWDGYEQRVTIELRP